MLKQRIICISTGIYDYAFEGKRKEGEVFRSCGGLLLSFLHLDSARALKTWVTYSMGLHSIVIPNRNSIYMYA